MFRCNLASLACFQIHFLNPEFSEIESSFDSVFTCSDGDARTDSGRLFQTDAAAAGKVRSPMVARTVRGATSADVVEERSRRYRGSVSVKMQGTGGIETGREKDGKVGGVWEPVPVDHGT